MLTLNNTNETLLVIVPSSLTQRARERAANLRRDIERRACLPACVPQRKNATTLSQLSRALHLAPPPHPTRERERERERERHDPRATPSNNDDECDAKPHTRSRSHSRTILLSHRKRHGHRRDCNECHRRNESS